MVSSVGPVPLPVALALCCLVLALLVVRLWRRADRQTTARSSSVLIDLFFAGWAGARLWFVLRHHQTYFADPWSMLRLGDGGYDPWGFLLATAVLAIWRLRGPGARLRMPVIAAALAGGLAWVTGSIALEALQSRQLPFPAVAVSDLEGRAMPLQAATGRPVVINLWASWCAPCIREMPVLLQAQRDNPDIDFLFVNQGEDTATVQAFLAQHAPGLQGVRLDPEAASSAALGVQAYPSTLFYSADARLRELHLGELSTASLDHKLRRLR